jgi:hypothetical protein
MMAVVKAVIHRPKFAHPKAAPPLANAFLIKDDRPWRIEADGYRTDDHHGQSEGQSQQAKNHIHHPFGDPTPSMEREYIWPLNDYQIHPWVPSK